MQSPDDAKENAKKTYVPPKLVRLGSVRDLTFGASTGTQSDGALRKKAVK